MRAVSLLPKDELFAAQRSAGEGRLPQICIRTYQSGRKGFKRSAGQG